ncbi:hypothetical protein T4B_14825 [Trichinella pseudospiralis]|uniref:Uncharacterized protein n=1 Tax=Trichinella pseudospiralis TaxID=6337 RepID=A0A0V1J934_TRIPS|nr:hypothetical protein T4B_14825 [Trichinella pseudospiralis]
MTIFNSSLFFKPANCYPFLTHIMVNDVYYFLHYVTNNDGKNQHVSILSICASSLQEVEKLFISNDIQVIFKVVCCWMKRLLNDKIVYAGSKGNNMSYVNFNQIMKIYCASIFTCVELQQQLGRRKQHTYAFDIDKIQQRKLVRKAAKLF